MPEYDDPNNPGPRLPDVAIGVVTNRVDPMKLRRVRVRIPGLIEPESGWVWPMTVGGGAARHGAHIVPLVGADVAVFFNQGDPDHPYYIGANYGMPGGVVQTPGKVADRPAEEVPNVAFFETERWLMVMDDNEETASLILEDKRNGNNIEMDGKQEGITVKSRGAIRLDTKGAVEIKAMHVQINGRVVRPSSDPI